MRAARDFPSEPVAAPSLRQALHPSWPLLGGIFLLVAALYFVAGRLALELMSEREGVAVFWPASGIAAGLAAVLTRPARMPIVLAVAAATVLANVLERASIPASLAFALCNAGECLLFVWLFEQMDTKRERLESLPSFAAFVLAAAVAAGVAALPAALAIQALGLSSVSLPAIWYSWFKSDGLGILTMAPAILTLPKVFREPPGLANLAEGLVGVAVAIALAYVAFAGVPANSIWPLIAPATLLFPAFLWLAGRTPALFSALGALGVSVVIVMTALTGSSRFGDTSVPLEDRLVGAEIAVMTLCLSVMTLAAMFARLSNVAAALRSSEHRLNLSLAAGRMYAFDFDCVRGIVRRSGGLLDKLKLPSFGTLADYRNSLAESDRADFERMLLSLSPNEPRSMRILHLHAPDGEVITVEHRAEGVFGNDNKVLRVSGTCVDITERERTRRALEENEAQLRGALVAGRVFAFDYDVRTGTILRSDNAAEILGVSLVEARSSESLVLERIHPDDRHVLLKYREDLTPANPHTRITFRFIRPSGAITWLEMQAKGEYDDNGRLVRRRGLCHDVTEEMQAKEQLESLIKELDHRVKNALATVNDIVELSRDGHTTVGGFIAALEKRIQALKRTHDRLTSTRWAGVALRDVVEGEIEPYRTGGNARLDGPDVILRPKLAQAFALTVHELATNAAKHGALGAFNGKVEVNWRIDRDGRGRDRLSFAWREHSLRSVEPPTRESYGMQAIRSQLAHSHEATVELRFTPGGLECDIVFPLHGVGEPANADTVTA